MAAKTKTKTPKAVSQYMAKIGAKGGSATGGRKKRGSAQMRALVMRRWTKRDRQPGGEVKTS